MNTQSDNKQTEHMMNNTVKFMSVIPMILKSWHLRADLAVSNHIQVMSLEQYLT